MLSQIPSTFVPLRLRRRLSLLLAAAVGLAVLVAVPAPAFAAAPANDDFANAQVLSGGAVTASGSNEEATPEFGEPRHAGVNGGASVWYSWTAPADGTATVDPAGSNFDTVVAVYTGTAVDALTVVASVDDTDGSPTGRASFPVADGTTYAIAVDGYNASTGSIELSISLAAGPTGSISGHLTDRQYGYLAGVCADAYSAEGDSAGQATSDALGAYSIPGLSNGTYRVGFSDCGSGTYPEFYSDAATYDLAKDVTVAGGQQTTDIDARLGLPSDPAVVSGRVTDTAGNPLSDICVDLVGTSIQWQVRTDADGRYRAEVDPGDYTAQFFSCSLSYPIEQWYDGKTQANATTFTVANGRETTGIDAQMVIGGQVAGTVTNDAGTVLALVCVDLMDEAGVRVQDPIVTGTAGTFRFRDVVPGTYVVQYRNCRNIGPYADEYYKDATTLAGATPVAVTAGGTAVANGVLETVPTPDTVILTGPTAGSTTAGTVTFTFAGDPADQVSSFMCRTGTTGSYSACTSPRTISVASGSRTFSVYAIGKGGTSTRDQTPATRTFTVDATPPNTAIASGPIAGSIITADSATFTLSGTANDTAKFQCRIDDAAWADCTSPTTFQKLSEGAHIAAFRAEDAVGNQDPSPATRAFTVDTIAPDTTIDSGASGAISTDAAVFEFHGTVGETAKIQCQVDGGGWTDCTSPLGLTGLAEGDHTVGFRAQDAVGNQDPSPATRSFAVDTIAPDTAIDSGPAGTITTDEATFEFHGSVGDTESLQCRLDGQPWVSCTSPLTLDDLSDGDHTLDFRAVDAAGNQDPDPATRVFTVDTIAPDTTIDSGPADAATVAADSVTFTFHGTETETADIHCRLDTGDWADCTSPATFDGLADGDHTVGFRAQDAAGNQDQTPATRDFTVDTTAPDTTIDVGPTGAIGTDRATFEASGTAGDTATIQCRIDVEDWADCTSRTSFEDLAEGEHTVEFRAQDAAGNTDETPATRSFTVDTVAPDTTLDSGPAEGGTITTRSTTFTFHGTAGDTMLLECKVDGAAWAACTSPKGVTALGDGSHTVAFRATDLAGNVDATPATRTFRVQVPVVVPAPPQAPTQASTKLTLTAPSKVSTKKWKAKVTIKIQLKGVASGRIVIRDGKKIVKTITVRGRKNLTLTLKAGTHKLTASFAGTSTAKAAKTSVRKVVVKRKH